MASLAIRSTSAVPYLPVVYKGFRVGDLPSSFLALLGDAERKRNLDDTTPLT